MTNISKEQNIELSGRLKNVLSNIENTLNQYGYIEISLPIYEYYDLLQDTVFNFSDESIIRFIDRHTGKTLVIKVQFFAQLKKTGALKGKKTRQAGNFLVKKVCMAI